MASRQPAHFTANSLQDTTGQCCDIRSRWDKGAVEGTQRRCVTPLVRGLCRVLAPHGALSDGGMLLLGEL